MTKNCTSGTADNDWRDALRNIAGLPDPDDDGNTGRRQSNQDAPQVKKPRLDIIIDRKGRAGKTATIIAGFSAGTPDSEISALAASLKSKLGTGGSARGGEILIQGDRRSDVSRLLESLGYPTRII